MWEIHFKTVKVPDLVYQLRYVYWQAIDTNSGSCKEIDGYLFEQYYDFIELMGVWRPRLRKQRHMLVRVDRYQKQSIFLLNRKSVGTTAAVDAVNDS